MNDTVTISGRATILDARANRLGFLTAEEVQRIATDPETRLTMLLVRCGGGRFLAPAQDVEYFIDIIEQATIDGLHPMSGMLFDHVRDISIGRQNDPTLSQVEHWLEKRGVFPTTLKYIRQAIAIA